MSETSIVFPYLGVTLSKVGRYLSIGGFEIAYYGMAVALGMYLGINLILLLAKRSGQNEDRYLTLCLITLLFGVAGARLYYILFSWGYYKDHLTEIFFLREGGLAIYGGILVGVVVVFVYSRRKKLPLLLLADTIVPGLALGQAVGRWGNFFNREAFGRYTDSIFAMALPKAAVYPQDITEQMLSHSFVLDGIEFIQVHPAFLYESVWNLGLLTTLLLFFSKKKFDGQIFALYLGGYGIGRVMIESLRTDQLLVPGTMIPVSILVSVLFIFLSAGLFWRLGKCQKN